MTDLAAPAPTVAPPGTVTETGPVPTRADLGLVSGLVVLLVLTQRIGVPTADSVISAAIPFQSACSVTADP